MCVLGEMSGKGRISIYTYTRLMYMDIRLSIVCLWLCAVYLRRSPYRIELFCLLSQEGKE